MGLCSRMMACRTFWVAFSAGSWSTPFLKYASVGRSIIPGVDDVGDVMLNAPLGGIEGVGSKFIFSGRNSSCSPCIMTLSNYRWLKKSFVFASMSLFTCLLKFYHVGGHTNEVVEARTRLTCPLAVIWTTVKACRKNNNNDDAYYYYFLSRRKK